MSLLIQTTPVAHRTATVTRRPMHAPTKAVQAKAIAEAVEAVQADTLPMVNGLTIPAGIFGWAPLLTTDAYVARLDIWPAQRHTQVSDLSTLLDA